jgi:hypothetical protein
VGAKVFKKKKILKYSPVNCLLIIEINYLLGEKSSFGLQKEFYFERILPELLTDTGAAAALTRKTGYYNHLNKRVNR